MTTEKKRRMSAAELEDHEKMARWLGRVLSEASEGRYDHLAKLRAQAVVLSDRYRDAGEEWIADQILSVTGPRRSQGRQQEWLNLDHAILVIGVFTLMQNDSNLSIRAACRQMADTSIDRSWFVVFDSVVAVRHTTTEQALYEQFRYWLQKNKSSISEFNDLRKAHGGDLRDLVLPPHLVQALSAAAEWFKWLQEKVPEN